MDIKEKAKEYAEGKMTEAIEKVIADAYAEGYKDRDEEISLAIKQDSPEFIDFELSDGTMWAVDFLRDENGDILELTYHEAHSQYSLPTWEQVQILEKECRLCRKDDGGFSITTPKGVEFNYPLQEFWIDGDIDSSSNEAPYAYMVIRNNTGAFSKYYRFTGYRRPVLVVRKK